jgi:general secretion pathway protein L
MDNNSLILDIGEQCIKALVIKENSQKAVIHGNCQVFKNDVEQSEKEFNFFHESLKIISKKIDLKDFSTATLFIPSSMISFRNSTLPFKAKRKLKKVLDYELTFMLPLNNTTYISDFTYTDISLSENQNHIFSASVPEHFIKIYFDSLNDYNIKPELITIKGYVKANWLAKKNDVSKIIFLDIQEEEKTLTFAVNNKVVFVRSLKSSDVPEALAQEIYNTYLSFKQKIKLELIIDKIIITSGDDNTSECHDKLSDIFTSKFSCPTAYTAAEADLLLFLIKEKKNLLNFCQAQYKNDSFLKEHIRKIAVTAGIATLIIAFGFLNNYLEISSLEKKLSLYKDAQVKIFKETFPKQSKIVDPFLQMKSMTKSTKKTNLKGSSNILEKQGIRSIDILLELSDKIPAGIDIVTSRVLFNGNQLIFSGSTNNFNNIDKIKNSLKQSDIFHKVNISKATADKKDGNVLFKFIIKF